ncbi:MAG: DNA-directed RNA polymerase subunit omega [Calditrichaeota bacterium]|nr:MAG: DNA-directed RNA polymerase subunit omega [Calditrichota bacterium]
MISTLDIQELIKHADTVYEAIIIIARRARQINTEQKIFLERELELEEVNEDFEEEDFGQPVTPEMEIKLPKPPSVALEEFLRGELQKEYAEENIN